LQWCSWFVVFFLAILLQHNVHSLLGYLADLIRMGYQLLLVVEIILGVFMLLVEYILQLYHLRGFGKTSDLVVQPEPYLQDRRIQFVQEALQGQWVAQ
jgi:hypothetical protein